MYLRRVHTPIDAYCFAFLHENWLPIVQLLVLSGTASNTVWQFCLLPLQSFIISGYYTSYPWLNYVSSGQKWQKKKWKYSPLQEPLTAAQDKRKKWINSCSTGSSRPNIISVCGEQTVLFHFFFLSAKSGQSIFLVLSTSPNLWLIHAPRPMKIEELV